MTGSGQEVPQATARPSAQTIGASHSLTEHPRASVPIRTLEHAACPWGAFDPAVVVAARKGAAAPRSAVARAVGANPVAARVLALALDVAGSRDQEKREEGEPSEAVHGPVMREAVGFARGSTHRLDLARRLIAPAHRVGSPRLAWATLPSIFYLFAAQFYTGRSVGSCKLFQQSAGRWGAHNAPA